MRILFDQGTPVPLRQSLTHHEVTTAYERDWSRLKNGELLDIAEKQGFEVLVTTDSNLKYQIGTSIRRPGYLPTLGWKRIAITTYQLPSRMF